MQRPAEPVFMRVPVELIEPGSNVRVDDQGLDALADSIRKHGVLQPITVVPLAGDDGRVECLFGHRRLAAAKVAGLEVIPCLARPRERAEVRVLTQIAENRDRRAMSPLEEGLAYAELRKLRMSQAQIAVAVGTTQPAVSQRLILLDYPDPVKQAVHWRKIGLNEALSIPLELANNTDGRTLAAVLRRGPLGLRKWMRDEIAAARAEGRTVKPRRVRFEHLNLESELVDDLRDAAERAGVTIADWCRPVLRAAIDAQATGISTERRYA